MACQSRGAHHLLLNLSLSICARRRYNPELCPAPTAAVQALRVCDRGHSARPCAPWGVPRRSAPLFPHRARAAPHLQLPGDPRHHPDAAGREGGEPSSTAQVLRGRRRRGCTRVCRGQPMPGAESSEAHLPRSQGRLSHPTAPPGRLNSPDERLTRRRSSPTCAVFLAELLAWGWGARLRGRPACVWPALFAPALRHPQLTFHIK